MLLKPNKTNRYAIRLASIFLLYGSEAYAQESYSPYVDQTNPSTVYWGDTHLHTNLSVDAYNFGNRKLGPEEAYRFAKGEAVTAHNGMQARLHRPLDFLVIADHASNMSVMTGLETNDSRLLGSEIGQRWAERVKVINQSAQTDRVKATQLSQALFFDGFREGVVAEDDYRLSA